MNTKPESQYRSIKKWIRGEPISLEFQVILEEELELPAGYLYEANPAAARQRELERQVSQIVERVSQVEATLADLREDLVALRSDHP